MTMEMFSDGYYKLLDNGSLKPLNEESGGLELLLENMWYLVLSKLRLHTLEVPPGRLSRKGYVRCASRHLHALMSPHYSDDVRAGVQEVLKAKFT